MIQPQLGDYLTRNVKPQISNLPDVGLVNIYSDIYAMRLWLDPQKMAAHNVTASDVSNAVSNNNVQGTMGQLKSDTQIFNIMGKNTEINTAE
ncbi:efflux RND transporter permease subunit, partial [Acinetobacter baumannii]